MAFQLPKAEDLAAIIANSRPRTPLDLTEVTDADGTVLSQDEARHQINEILGEAGPLPAMEFPLFEELIVGNEILESARINTIVRDGKVAGQMIEIRIFGCESLDRYQAMGELKRLLKDWMPVLSHPMFGLGKASLSDRLDKELKGKAGRAKGGAYLQLSWSFEFVTHAELYEYQTKAQDKTQTQDKTQDQTQSQNQGESEGGNVQF